MNNRTYIPGFDWMKLVGATFVAWGHLYGNSIIMNFIDLRIAGLLHEIVPIFFMISGYVMYLSLTRKSKPIGYVCSYLMKYGIIYLTINFLSYLPHYIEIFIDSGIFMYKDFIYVMCTLPIRENRMYHLWFIPSLLIGIAVNSIVFRYEKEKTFGFLILLMTIARIGLLTYGEWYSQITILQNFVKWTYFDLFLKVYMTALKGTLFVYMGMWFAKYGEKISQNNIRIISVMACIISIVEAVVMFRFADPGGNYVTFNFSVCLWSNIIFYIILHIKNDKIKPYHSFVTLYSGITYFLHVPEQFLLGRWIQNGPTLFWVITCMNILLAYTVDKLLIGKNLKGHKNGL